MSQPNLRPTGRLGAAMLGLLSLVSITAACQADKCARGDSCDKACDAPEVPICVVDGICRCQPPSAGTGGTSNTDGGAGGNPTPTGDGSVNPSTCVGPATGELVLNEILFKGGVDGESDEFVELVNTTDHAVGLTGVRIYSVSTAGNETDRFVFSAGCLAPRSAAAFFHLQDLTAAQASSPFIEPPATSKKQSATKYANTGDIDYRLSGPNGPLGQFSGARSDIDDGTGESVNRVTDGVESALARHTTVSANHAKSSPAHCANGGTFEQQCLDGATDTDGGVHVGDGGLPVGDGSHPAGDAAGPSCLAGATAPVVINEVLANPTGGSESHAEFVELVNSGDAPVVMDGYTLWISGSDGALAQKLAFGTATLPARGAVAVFGNTTVDQWVWAPDVPATVASESFGIVNSGNPLHVQLKDAAGAVVDSVDIAKALSAADGVSANRCEDVDGTTFVLHNSLGATGNSPAHCANGARFADLCVPAPGSMP